MADQNQPLPHSQIIIGGGGDGRGGNTSTISGGDTPSNSQPGPRATSSTKRDSAQKDAYWFSGDGNGIEPANNQVISSTLAGPNELFFGTDRSSGLSYKDREERVRQLRERQLQERSQKLEELKEQAAAAQKFREQQEQARRQRLEDIRSRDAERRTQVEERKRMIQEAEQERREAVLRKTAEREQRVESKRRNEKSNIVFAFGSSTPRMLDPKETCNSSYYGPRRATSTTNVHLADTSNYRHSGDRGETDLSRKRATSAHSLDRKPDGEEDLMTRSMTAAVPTAARRRTDLLPTVPSLRDGCRGSPRHRSPGRTLSLSRLDQLARPKHQRSPPLAPLHESKSSSSPPNSASTRMKPTRTMSKSMSHLGPKQAQVPQATAARATSGRLDRKMSRSSAVLTQPRPTRSEILRQKMRNSNPETKSDSQGMSGTVTPNSPSRPASALSQGSTGSSVSLRPRTSPRKPRPLSIAGSSPSAVDKPRHTATTGVSPPRESRSIERKLSSGPGLLNRPLRAKSAGSDSAPTTPSRATKPSIPKRTPAQVKAESNAKKAIDKSKSTPRSKGTPRTTPMQSPAVENKSLPGSEVKSMKSMSKSSSGASKEELMSKDKVEKKVVMDPLPVETTDKKETEPTTKEDAAAPAASNVEATQNEPQVQNAPTAVAEHESKEEPPVEIEKEVKIEDDIKLEPEPEELGEDNVAKEAPEKEEEDESGKTPAQRAAEKPVTGYATEEEYKQALAEKRRQVREAREREQELERQRELERQEKERKEEEEYLRLMDEQRKAEEERLKKAIEEADKLREEEAKRKEEEEKQRIENERIEEQKRKETEERLRKEEEERRERKNRVAAIMARTRSKGGSSTPSKTESKTPSEESKPLVEMTGSMTDSMIAAMTDSMIAAVEESQNSTESTEVAPPDESCSQSGSKVEEQTEVNSTVVSTTNELIENKDTSNESNVQNVESHTVNEDSNVDSLISGVTSIKVVETHVNGDSPVPMDTTPTQSVDLLGSLNGVHSVNHNGINNTSPASTNKSSSNITGVESSTGSSTAASNFEQIIDLNQTNLNNEDAINSNPSTPFIAFEQNLNKKPQENTSAVPDLLL